MAFGANPPPIQAHICVKGGLDAIEFYKKAFDANCAFHQLADDGKRVMHANIELFGGEVKARPMMYLALSYDHRIIDGREAVLFLVRVKECIEDPERLLLGV